MPKCWPWSPSSSWKTNRKRSKIMWLCHVLSVFELLSKERVLESLSCGDPLTWLVDEYSREQVAKTVVKGWRGRKHLSQTLHLSDEFPRILGRRLIRVVQSTWGPKHLLCYLWARSYDSPVYTSTHNFHHGKMFDIIVSLKQCITREEFHQYASYTPDIARETPAKL